MSEPFLIKHVAILGAGVMGAQIAAHCANAGIKTYLYDLAQPDASPNALIDKAIAHLSKLKPAPLGTPHTASLIIAKNYKENLADLGNCDLVIEAVAERMDIKAQLYETISPLINPNAVLASNTSGLSINKLSQLLPEQLQPRFCGVHFFNPPRYMHLVELIPAERTDLQLLDNLETWLTNRLGKGVVRAKDTPNFIANRIGVFSLLTTLYHAEQFGLAPDEVDALTGPLIGRPSSATFRTMDVVGLDTLSHVVKTMHDHLQSDPWHNRFKLPNWLAQLIQEGHLGQKTGQGIFKKTAHGIEVFDPQIENYRSISGKVADEIKQIFHIADVKKRWQALVDSTNKQAKFLIACYEDLFHYSAYHLEEIAHSARDIDNAMCWGFGWKQGPFELWQRFGVREVAHLLKNSSIEVPTWLSTIDSFYKNNDAYAPSDNRYHQSRNLPIYKRQYARLDSVLYENEGVKLVAYHDEAAVLSFKSKANTFTNAVLDGLSEALFFAEHQCSGIIIYQDDANTFSAGANLLQVANYLSENNLTAVEAMVAQFQQVMMRIKYAPIPIVAALRGKALGGGCELALHCSAIVAAFESYPGLVEVGVGLIPAGGGCKEMALRAAELAGSRDIIPLLHESFQQIATAYVANSAADAKVRGFLQAGDCWIMNANEVLYASLSKLKSLVACSYRPPQAKLFKVAGREGHARLEAELVNWLEGQFISQYDFHLANTVASVLCGGDVNAGELVDEDWMLKIEREAFISLAASPLTQARIKYMLETGKPLRN